MPQSASLMHFFISFQHSQRGVSMFFKREENILKIKIKIKNEVTENHTIEVQSINFSPHFPILLLLQEQKAAMTTD